MIHSVPFDSIPIRQVGKMSTYRQQAKERIFTMSEQKKAIDMTPEELRQWLGSLTVSEDNDIPCYYFSTSDPYLKHEPIREDQPRRNIHFDENGNIVVKNISAYWIPELTVTEEISSTIYTVTGSYEGEDNLIRKLERITSRKFTNQLGGHQ